MEEGIAIVLEVEDIIAGLIFDFDVCEALGSEVASIKAISFEAFNDDALSVFEVTVVFLLGHKIYSN